MECGECRQGDGGQVAVELSQQIFTAKVMHKRLLPKVNGFTYGVYYLAQPLHASVERRGVLSFRVKDHGARDGSDLQGWIRTILRDYGLDDITAGIQLIAMPRILGYGFNPVSFWLCVDVENMLRAVLCEVNNTFGETHSYLCAHADHRPIHAHDWLQAEKLFHVSPFLPREGSYQFRFTRKDESLGIWIDYYNAQGQKQLITSLTGTLEPLTEAALRRVFWRHPLVTLKTIGLIHWQALRLVVKGIRYIPKPVQLMQRLSCTHNLTKL